jgi:hypothetical protein
VKRAIIAAVAVLTLVACTVYNVGSYDNNQRQFPIYVIGIACGNGIPNGQQCMNNYQCCSGHCEYGLTTMGAICVQCTSDFDCSDPMFPVCEQTQCVSSGGTQCVPQSGSCAINPCCAGLKCDSSFVCNFPVADSGGGG